MSSRQYRQFFSIRSVQDAVGHPFLLGSELYRVQNFRIRGYQFIMFIGFDIMDESEMKIYTLPMLANIWIIVPMSIICDSFIYKFPI